MDKCWAFYNGFVLVETDKAVAFGRISSRVDMWIPKSQLGEICYLNGGDSDEIRIQCAVSAVEIPSWLALKNDLIIDEE